MRDRTVDPSGQTSHHSPAATAEGGGPVAWMRIEDVASLRGTGRAVVFEEKPSDDALPLYAAGGSS